MRRREANAIRARRALLEAARDEFRTRGYEGASMRRIAAGAGVATGTVFNYFDGKLALLHAVLHEQLEHAIEQALAVDEAEPVLDQLLHIASILLESYAHEPALSRVLLKESLFATGPAAPGFQAQVQAVADSVRARVVRDGTAVDADTVTLTFVSAYYFGLIRMLASDSAEPGVPLEGIRRQLQALLEAKRS
jgi:AcrR family transcriptional regulator